MAIAAYVDKFRLDEEDNQAFVSKAAILRGAARQRVGISRPIRFALCDGTMS
jgi:hypothetical protein